MIRAVTTEWPDDLAANWFDYRHRSHGSRAERKALEMGDPQRVITANQMVSDVIDTGGPDAVAIVTLLAKAALNDDDLAAVGMGPIEDLVNDHGDAIIDPLVDACRQVPALARALAHAFIADDSVSERSLALLQLFDR